MEYLLVVFLFTMNPQGDFEQFEVATQEFQTLEACNVAGRNFRLIAGLTDPKYDGVKSLSYCVKPEDYDK